MQLPKLQRCCAKYALEMLSEGSSVSVAHLLDYLLHRMICLGEKRAGVLYSYVLEIGLKGDSYYLLELAARKRRIEKFFGADFGK